MQLKNRIFILMTLFGFSVTALAAEVTISCGAVGQELFLCKQAVAAWAEKTGHTANVAPAPQTTDQRYTNYVERLEAGDDSIDVYQIDVIWPGLMAKYFVDLRDFIPEEDIEQHYSTIIDNNTVDGRLVGMPWYTDVGLLYYRKDLLAKYNARVPNDYSELADVALHIQSEERKAGNPQIWGYIFQGEAYEGLTCNALEWIAAYGGGTIIDDNGKPTVNNPQAITAINRAASWVGTIAPERVISFREEDGRLTFTRGDAVFMRNWPYVWNLVTADDMSPVAGKVDIAPLPRGGAQGRHASTLGGWQLAVSQHSKNPEVAADLVRYLTSAEVQKERAIEGSYAPTIRSLYDDPQVLRSSPVFGKLQPILEDAVARPTSTAGEHYMAVSDAFAQAVHQTLAGGQSADKSLAALQEELQKILAGSSQ